MSFKRKPPKDNVRNVRTNGKNIRGVVTNKNNEIVQYESFEEFKLILLFERNAHVINYRSQPIKFEFVGCDGKNFTYVPDFMAWKKDETIEIHEVTLELRKNKENIQRRERAARDICRQRGWKYIVHYETDLPTGTELANLISLYGFNASAYYVTMIANSVKKFLAHGKLDVTTLVTQVSASIQAPEVIVSGCVYHMLWRNDLVVATNTLLFIDGYPNRQTAIAIRQ